MHFRKMSGMWQKQPQMSACSGRTFKTWWKNTASKSPKNPEFHLRSTSHSTGNSSMFFHRDNWCEDTSKFSKKFLHFWNFTWRRPQHIKFIKTSSEIPLEFGWIIQVKSIDFSSGFRLYITCFHNNFNTIRVIDPQQLCRL